MDRATDDILEKVQKLMALGESPSENEAAAALAKARELLARYGLSMADVKPRDREVAETVLLEKRRLRKWESQLIWVVTQATFTQALHVQRGDLGQVLIIGREVNMIAATELFEYLHLIVLKLGRAHGNEVSHLDSFKIGVVERIGERLASSEDSDWDNEGAWGSRNGSSSRSGSSGRNSGSGRGATAGTGSGEPNGTGATSGRELTVRMGVTAERENRDYIASKYGKTKTKRAGNRVDAASYYRGREAGDGVALNRQLQ